MLRIRHLLISVNTDKGQFGVKRDFADGVNVIRAKNWAGKSTLLQSIVYAMGLEGMFSPSHDVPLAHALTDYLEYNEGKAKVIDSMVSLEIENGNGQFLTVQRSIAGERHRHLITVYEGRAITKNEAIETRHDYFVREAHAATSERGFHRRLTEFLGWTLPLAPRFNDVDCPLYLETIFPLLYVEQKLGWGRLPARYPTWLGIRDVARRTVEFLLGLDAYAIAIERVAVQDEVARVRTEWTSLRSRTNRLSSLAGGLVQGIPTEPISIWPPEVVPQLVIASGSDWVQLPTYLKRLHERLAVLQAQPVPSAASDNPHARNELRGAESQLAERERQAGALISKIESDSSEVQALRQRIEGIEDDLRKYKDVRRLRKLGSPDELEVTKGVCPTCHQELVDSLLETGKKTTPMSVDQNVSFYEEQLQLFSAVFTNAQLAIEASQMQLQSQRSDIDALRNRIRELRETLVSTSNTPSVEAVGERIRLENRIGTLEGILTNFEDSLGEFGQLAVEWRDVQERRARLPKGALSAGDESKISTFQQSFRQQLVLYSMGSLNPAELNISRDNYVPEVSGLNLRADVSGSDLIRLQWAYLLGLLELGLSVPTNHPGLLIMDDPQQQSVEEGPFRAMLRYAKTFVRAQIIIATSHDTSIDDFLKTIGVTNISEFGDNRLIDRI
jgi:predicted  nucleic acid-binding Zn-ribbon protein